MPQYHFALDQKTEAAALIKRFHYTGRTSQMLIVGTWHEDGGLFGDSGPAVAACVFGHPSAPWGETILELNRLVRTPECSGSLSGLIAKTAKFAYRLTGIDLLVSYADATQEHHGGVYQASSWNYHGKRKATIDALWVNGVYKPTRTLGSVYGTQNPAKIRAMGFEVVEHWDEGKFLYWRAMDRNGRRKAERLGLNSIPYPKPQFSETGEVVSP